MTITVLGYRITLNIIKLERCNLAHNVDQARREAYEIMNNETFQAIKQKALAYRQEKYALEAQKGA